MRPLRAYLWGGAASGALIGAALAAFLSVTAIVSQGTFPGEDVSPTRVPEAATVEVGPLDTSGPGTSSSAPSVPSQAVPVLAATALPVLAATALPVPASEPPRAGAGSSAGGENGAGRRAKAGRAGGSRTEPSMGLAAGDSPGAKRGTDNGSSTIAKTQGGRVPPGLAKRDGGLPPGLAKKPGGLPPGLAKKDKVPPGHARKHR